MASSTSSPSLALWLLLYPDDPLLELLTVSHGNTTAMFEVTGEGEEGKVMLEEEQGKMDINSLVGVFESGLHGLCWKVPEIKTHEHFANDDDDDARIRFVRD